MDNQQVNAKLFVGLAVVVTALSLFVVIICGVAYTKTSVPHVSLHGPSVYPSLNVKDALTPPVASVSYKPDKGKPVSPVEPTIWSVAVGHDYGAHEYIDEDGELCGFGIDLINSVCTAAGAECRIVWDEYTNCWDTEAGFGGKGGKGLHGRWYDACIGWYVTTDRLRTFSFSTPHTKAPSSFFFVNSAANFNPLNISGSTIAFLDGSACDEKCIARQKDIIGKDLDARHIIYAKTTSQLLELVKHGQVDAGFATFTVLESLESLSEFEILKAKPISCMLTGNSIMTRKDGNFLAIWEKGLQTIRSNGKFDKLCSKDHGSKGTVDCVNS